MKKLSFLNDNFEAKAYGSILAITSVAIIVFSLYRSLSYPFIDWLTLCSAAVIYFIFSRYRFRIPRTRKHISARESLIFWIMIWLGGEGSVLLALFSAIYSFRRHLKHSLRWLLEISFVVIASFISSLTFYFTLKFGLGFDKNPIADNPINIFWLLGGLIIVGVLYFAVYSLLFLIFQMLHGSSRLHLVWKNLPLWAGVSTLSCVAIVFSFYLIIVYFKLLASALVLPGAIITHFFYRFQKKIFIKKVEEINEKSRIYFATIEALVKAINARAPIRSAHVVRKQVFAVGIGKALNLGNEEINALKIGALLHDVGKLAVPDHILKKSGKLTPAEMERLKVYPEVSASILERVNFPCPVSSTIRSQNESWDGSGYPEGLSKEEIPLTARILAVVSAYDEIYGVSHDPPSTSRKNARKYILGGAGIKFDPTIVDVFMRNLMELEKEVRRKELLHRSSKSAIHLTGKRSDDKNKLNYVEQIKQANQEAFSLYELARVFSSSLNLQEILSTFVEKIEKLVSMDTCIVYLLDETQHSAVATYVKGKNRNALKKRKVRIGRGATGYALKKRQPVHNIPPRLDFSFHQMEFVQEYTSMASLPLIANEQLLGAVSLYSCELEKYEDEHIRLLETPTLIASNAISTSLRHSKSETMALTDVMTSLPNARSLQIQFEKEASRARRSDSRFQILMIDLDGFKAVNDNFGHKVGDRLLRDVAAIMQKQLRSYDFLARYAGDEFVAIIPEAKDEVVKELCQRIEKAVAEYKLNVGDDLTASVGVSLGAATYPISGMTLDQIIASADKVMYEVKAKKAKLERKKNVENSKTRKDEAPIPVSGIHIDEIDVEPIEAVEVLDEVLDFEKEPLIVELQESHKLPTKPTKK